MERCDLPTKQNGAWKMIAGILAGVLVTVLSSVAVMSADSAKEKVAEARKHCNERIDKDCYPMTDGRVLEVKLENIETLLKEIKAAVVKP